MSSTVASFEFQNVDHKPRGQETGVQLVHSLNEALESTKANRIFIIGGSTIYSEALALPPAASSSAYVDRVLLTRIVSPVFESCDVFLPDFLGDGGGWKRAPHEELNEWAGFEVLEGEQEEKGVNYEFQMWTRG